MECYICKKEAKEIGKKYTEKVCNECTEKFDEVHEKVAAFRKQYSEDHAACPKCGETFHLSTMVGYPLYADKFDEYKDLNRCECDKCGDKHIAHDRVPKPIKNKKAPR